MQIGWIDYSKEDRKKVLSVIDLLSEDGTLDELGVAPIRDGFANLFFPGTSTIQTRAKYFLIVPYALDMLSRQSDPGVDSMLRKLDDIELRCAKTLVASRAERVIGSRAIASGGWVKRPPSEIYWAGIRRYGIFTRENMSLAEYARVSGAIRKRKLDVKKLGNRNDDAGEFESDDADAGSLYSTTFWNLPYYSEDWMDTLKMRLTPDEAVFLKSQIESSQSDSMFSHILKNNMRNITKLNSFYEFGESNAIGLFSEQLQKDQMMALAFSRFFFGAIVRYNVILSEGKNQKANKEWEDFRANMADYASLDIEPVLAGLDITNPTLRLFLNNVKTKMLSDDIPALDECIRSREVSLKGPTRAKLNHAGEFRVDTWAGGGRLDYRFSNAMTIARDIFQGLDGGADV